MQGRVFITSPVAGRVIAQSAERLPAPGTLVHKGQLLAEIEQTVTASERVQLDVAGKGAAGAGQEAKAALDAAAAEYQRSQNLLQAKIVSRKRVEEAEAAWLQAQSRYETARRQESSYRAAQAADKVSARHFALTAPIDGTIVQADITAGQQVDTAAALFTIADLSTVWVEAPVFEGDLDKVDAKSPVAVRRSGETPPSQHLWTGTPIYAGVVVDPVKRTAGLLYEVNNSDGQLKLGMSVTVALPAGLEQQAVMAPETAVLENGGGKGMVYIQRNAEVFTEEEVTLGIRQDGLVEITGEVQVGDKLVVTGAAELFGKGPGRLPEAE
jgi:cobalt-zinc-cadmium efflux system membrane fusion protein